MILKKYRIGPVGSLDAVYKRIKTSDATTQDEMCALCGIGQNKCKGLKVYKEDATNFFKDLTYYSLCYGLELPKKSKSLRGTNNITYIPWRFR